MLRGNVSERELIKMCKEKVSPMSSPPAAAMTAVSLLLLVRMVTPVLPQQGSYHPQYGTYIGRLTAYVEGISGRVRHSPLV